MKRLVVLVLSLAALTSAWLVAQSRGPLPAKPLDIYVVDVEGGKATLFVSPTGQTLLIDTGFPGARDIDRVMDAINAAGVKQIDYMLLTHYHVDHVGNVLELSKRIPVGRYIDHGPTVEGPVVPALREQVPGFQQAYSEINAGKHLVVKPGDRVPITGIEWTIVSAAGNVLKPGVLKPAPAGAGRSNSACAAFKPKQTTTDPENAQSVGSLIRYDQFRAMDLGDLLWDKEFELMCPNNPIGNIDLYLVSHHGSDLSGSEVLVHALRPRVAVMQNGTRKGGSPSTLQILHASPGLEDLWATHWSYPGGLEQNPAALFISNIEDNATIAGALTAPARGGGGGRPAGPPAAGPGGPPQGQAAQPAPAPPAAPQPAAAGAAPPAGAPQPAGPPAQGAPGGPGGGGGGGRGGGNATGHTPAYSIKISALPDRSFTVTNPRNGFSKTYAKR